MWTGPEKDIFQEKYLQHPKNFGLIAQYLERKTVADCVQYYYLSKKTENYKQLLRRSKTRRPRAPRQPAAAAPPPEVIPTGMTTTRPWTRNMRNEADKGTKEDNAGKGSRSGTPNIKNEENGDGNEKETGKKKPDRAREADLEHQILRTRKTETEMKKRLVRRSRIGQETPRRLRAQIIKTILQMRRTLIRL